MRRWERISREFSQLSTRSAWQALRRDRRKTTGDPQSALIRDLTKTGTPMSLASVKAALDAVASTPNETQSDKITSRIDGLLPSAKGSSIRFV